MQPWIQAYDDECGPSVFNVLMTQSCVVGLMMTAWNGNIIHITGPLWGDSPSQRASYVEDVTIGFPSKCPAMWTFDVFFDVRLNKRLSKQSRCRWFDMPPRSLWHDCNDPGIGRRLAPWGSSTPLASGPQSGRLGTASGFKLHEAVTWLRLTNGWGAHKTNLARKHCSGGKLNHIWDPSH